MNKPMLLLLLATLLPLPALAQTTDDERDAKIARLEQTVELLTRRLQALEAERTAPVAALPSAGPVASGPAAAAPAATPVPVAPVPPAVAADVAGEATAPLAMPKESPLPKHPTFDEDELAGARADNELPPGVEGMEGFFPVRGTNTWLRLSGYAKLDAMYDTDDTGYSDMFITSAFPTTGQSGDDSFNMHARQTRFTVEARSQTDYGPLRFVLQNDFFGPGGSYGYRLRHAWGQLRNTYVGYGWSAFMDLDSGPDTLDFAGPGVIPFGRVTSIRQYVPLKNGNQLVIAAEHAPPEITTADPGAQARNTAPNLVLALRHEGGSGHVQGGAMLRRLAYRGGGGSDETLAGGLSVSGAWGGEGAGYLTWGALGGRGIAAYIGDLLGLGLDAVVDDDGTLQALDEWGGWVGYGHPWNNDWRSTLTWGRLQLERDTLLAPGTFRRSDYLAANLIYAPDPSWSWGVEVLYGKLQDQAGDDADAFRVQTSLKYDFIK